MEQQNVGYNNILSHTPQDQGKLFKMTFFFLLLFSSVVQELIFFPQKRVGKVNVKEVSVLLVQT